MVLFVATMWLIATIQPELNDVSFAVAMAVLGIGMGLLAAQLGNVAQSSVGDAERSEVGGLQYTAQNLGSSLGTALIGSILVVALTSATLAGLPETRRSPTRSKSRSEPRSPVRSRSSRFPRSGRPSRTRASRPTRSRPSLPATQRPSCSRSRSRCSRPPRSRWRASSSPVGSRESASERDHEHRRTRPRLFAAGEAWLRYGGARIRAPAGRERGERRLVGSPPRACGRRRAGGTSRC